jgi:hypothetical protein
MIAHDAVSSLINLSDNLAVAKNLMDREFLVWLVSYTAVRPIFTGTRVAADPNQNTTSPLSPLTSMLLSNLTSHPSLVPVFAALTVPVVPLPGSSHYPPYFLPAAASASSTIHPDFRDPAGGSSGPRVGSSVRRRSRRGRQGWQGKEKGGMSLSRLCVCKHLHGKSSPCTPADDRSPLLALCCSLRNRLSQPPRRPTPIMTSLFSPKSSSSPSTRTPSAEEAPSAVSKTARWTGGAWDGSWRASVSELAPA